MAISSRTKQAIGGAVVAYVVLGGLLTPLLGTRIPQNLELTRGHDHELVIESVSGGSFRDGTLTLCTMARRVAYPPCDHEAPAAEEFQLRLDSGVLSHPGVNPSFREDGHFIEIDQGETTRGCVRDGSPVQVLRHSGGLLEEFDPKQYDLSEYALIDATQSYGYLGVYVEQSEVGPYVSWIRFRPVEKAHDVPLHRWIMAFVQDLACLPATIISLLIFGPG